MTVQADNRGAPTGDGVAPGGTPPGSIARVSVSAWREEPRVLGGPRVSLREIRAADAGLLCYHLNSANVESAVGCVPANVSDFERFIEWAKAERANGRLHTYSVVDRDTRAPAGIIQAWPRSFDGLVAEWGFGIGCAYWGTGFFEEAAVLLIDDLFGARRLQRLEALTSDHNRRSAAALRKLGANRQGLDADGIHTVWALLADEWRRQRGLTSPDMAPSFAAEEGGRR